MDSAPSTTSILKTLAAVGCVGLVLAMVSYLHPTAQYELEKNTPHLRMAGVMFEREIKEFGGTGAYARAAIAVEPLGVDDQHAYFHQFGHALYAVEGEKGISVCDARFGLGCFHQFLGDAIGDLGEEAVPRLYAECAETTGTTDLCQHGLGHGIVSGVGYAVSDLHKALAICDSVTKEKTYSGCYGGVFMEYNLRTIASAEGTMPQRLPENGDMYAPCMGLEFETAKICTFWLPEWWYFSVFPERTQFPLTNDVKNTMYEKLGALCAESGQPQSCYEGIGYITPTVFEFEALPARNACDHLGLQGSGNVYCRGMAGLIFNITGGESYKAPVLCQGLDAKLQNRCMTYASEKNFSFSMPEEQ